MSRLRDSGPTKTVQTVTDAALGDKAFRFLAESSSQGVFRVTNDGSVVFVNRRLCDLLGISAEQANNPKVWLGILHPDDRRAAGRAWRTALRERSSWSFECRVILEKSQRPLAESLFPASPFGRWRIARICRDCRRHNGEQGAEDGSGRRRAPRLVGHRCHTSNRLYQRRRRLWDKCESELV